MRQQLLWHATTHFTRKTRQSVGFCLSEKRRAIWQKNLGHQQYFFSSTTTNGEHTDTEEDAAKRQRPNISSWRRDELNGIRDKLSNSTDEIKEVRSDEELQDMWRQMESRVTKRRRPMTVQEAALKGKAVGRRNVRPTDEEVWLDAGLYSKDEDDKGKQR
uniref:Uncharacterized protein n=1 Tax=Leptocylindrus danicus TaxID=163516 RepID=A0A7S2LLP5_9STRA|mmetsp:Transcript_7294/g.10899  ORF Transcript_7294/g.10899 Transcript_7294/m.10899 type:complete len:160 (+) Transcript_7294:45-524(+)